MSIKIMSRIWDESPATGTSLLVLLALADHCNDDGECYPGVARIAKKARINTRQAQFHLASLESAGLIVRTHASGLVVKGRRGVGYTTKYRLILGPDNEAEKPKRDAGKGIPKTERGAVHGMIGVQSTVSIGVQSGVSPIIEPSEEEPSGNRQILDASRRVVPSEEISPPERRTEGEAFRRSESGRPPVGERPSERATIPAPRPEPSMPPKASWRASAPPAKGGLSEEDDFFARPRSIFSDGSF